MACGCPVIASTNTGAAELITDGQEGFIVIRSPDVIAERLQRLADSPDLRQRSFLLLCLRLRIWEAGTPTASRKKPSIL